MTRNDINDLMLTTVAIVIVVATMLILYGTLE